MSELTLGQVHGMVSNADFCMRLSRMTVLAEHAQKLTAFVVRRSENPHDPKLNYSPTLPLDGKESGSLLEREIARGQLGSLVTSTGCEGFQRPINAIAPLREDVEKTLEAAQTSPGLVRGIAAPEPLLGGISLLLYRQSPHRVYLPNVLTDMPTECNLRVAREVMDRAGINSIVIRYGGGRYILGHEQDAQLFR